MQPFPGPGAKTRVSTDGGMFPQWRGDGELLYIAPNNIVVSVRITLDGSAAKAEMPVTLFSIPFGSEYAASPDGQRFLVNAVVKEPAPITVILNWKPGIGK